jgi:hypothetical protein
LQAAVDTALYGRNATIVEIILALQPLAFGTPNMFVLLGNKHAEVLNSSSHASLKLSPVQLVPPQPAPAEHAQPGSPLPAEGPFLETLSNRAASRQVLQGAGKLHKTCTFCTS